MTTQQDAAVALLRECANYDDGWGVVFAGREPSHKTDGQAWIQWRTAEALERRGIVEIELERLRLIELAGATRPTRKDR